MLIAGIGQKDITPSIGDFYPQSNDIVGKPDGLGGSVQAVDGSLQIRALVLESEGLRFVLICVDTEGLTFETDRCWRKEAARIADVSIDHVRINASHSHTAIRYYPYVHHRLAPYHVRFCDLDQLDSIKHALCKAIQEAMQNRQPVTAKAGAAYVHQVAANRTVQKNGQTFTRYGGGDNGIKDAPEGLIDDEVTVLQLLKTTGEPLVTVCNYACHATNYPKDETGTLLVSPDFPGYAVQHIEREIGGSAMFVQGACGNVGTGKYCITPSLKSAKNMGERLGQGVERALLAAVKIENRLSAVRCHMEVLELCDTLPTKRQAEQMLQQAASDGERGSGLWRIGALLQVLDNARDVCNISLFSFQIGSFCFAGLPAESFIESALAIKYASPHTHTMVGAYFDCTCWYIPTRKAYRNGGYESAGGWSYIAPGGSERLSAAMIELIAKDPPSQCRECRSV